MSGSRAGVVEGGAGRVNREWQGIEEIDSSPSPGRHFIAWGFGGGEGGGFR